MFRHLPFFSYLCTHIMRTIYHYILIITFFLLNATLTSAQESSMPTSEDESTIVEKDSIRATLITCTPGTDVYAHFGHTALRIINYTNGADVVFNYGCFDSSQTDFVIKFIKGETDYVVNGEPADYFFARYNQLGFGVSEQVLNLTQEEALELANLLVINIQPENRGYRYNWLYDNCTTRARDMINKAINGKLAYKNELPSLSARDELHECLSNDSWLKFGIDLLLGTEIDTLAPRNIQQFIPAHYENDLDNAIIINADGSKRKLVLDKVNILDEKDFNKVSDTPITPVVVFCLLALITIALCIYDYRRLKRSAWFDVILHIAQGCAGIIIAYLFFFSVHPAVSTNWQVLLFNPLYFIYAGYIIYCQIKKKKDNLSLFIAGITIASLIIIALTGQSIPLPVYIIASIILMRTITTTLIQKH